MLRRKNVVTSAKISPGHHTLGLKYQNIFVTLQSDRPWSVQTFLNQRGVMSSACTDKA